MTEAINPLIQLQAGCPKATRKSETEKRRSFSVRVKGGSMAFGASVSFMGVSVAK